MGKTTVLTKKDPVIIQLSHCFWYTDTQEVLILSNMLELEVSAKPALTVFPYHYVLPFFYGCLNN